ncbi:MAG: helix-turn-helix transcriptional regulator [Bacteroidia bacterium]
MINPSFKVKEAVENTQKNQPKIITIDDDLALTLTSNQDSQALPIQGELDPKLIQFYFCTKGRAQFAFHRGAYVKELVNDRSFLFYNPEGPLAHEIHLAPDTQLLALFVSVKRLHEWFVQESGELAFLNNDNINQRLYAEDGLSPGLAMVIGQLFLIDPAENTRKLFYRAKALEMLSLYFSQDEDAAEEKCPFLHDEANVQKIKQAKQIIKDRMIDPPSLKELAHLIGLNEYQLKVGFKNIYGTTVYRYLTDYRMDRARKMLDSGSFRVNEAATEVGYSNPSHFIAAFKKKFGFTPKKYLTFIGK